MTWKELKRKVDEDLEREGLTEDVLINFINIDGREAAFMVNISENAHTGKINIDC